MARSQHGIATACSWRSHLEVGQLLPEPSIFRIKIHGILEPRLGFSELAVNSQGDPDLQVAVRQIGIKAKRFQIGAASFIPAIQPLQDVAQVVMMNRKVGLDPDRLLAVNQCFLGLSKVKQNQRESASGRRIPGSQLDGETKVLDGLIKLTELPQHHREVAVRLGKIGTQLDRPAEVSDGGGGTAEACIARPSVQRTSG